MKRPDYYNLQIAQCLVLPTGERVCILKTFWLRIIQRTWKKIYYQKKKILLKNIYLRNITGKLFLPSLKGMLSNKI
jgi:hypothetical protein